MGDNALKTPLAPALQRIARAAAATAIEQTGRALPCKIVSRSGSLAVVEFAVNAAPFTIPNITVPIMGSRYLAEPYAAGDPGVVFPADVRLSNISGQGGGIPDMTQPANLSTLMFFPIRHTSFADPGANLVLAANPAHPVTVTPDGGLATTGPLKAANGATGTFVSQDGKTVTVVKGIITSIV
jgi:hypothetical protein